MGAASPPRSSTCGTILCSRPLRTVLLVIIFIAVLVHIPFTNSEGEQWKLSHYVHKPSLHIPIGYAHPDDHDEAERLLQEGELGGHVDTGTATLHHGSDEDGTTQKHGLGQPRIGGVQKGDSNRVQPHDSTGSKLAALHGVDKALAQASDPLPEKIPAGVTSLLHGQGSTAVGSPITSTGTTGQVNSDSKYAYVFYATEDAYACSVLVNIDRLQTGFKTEYPIYVLATSDLSHAYLDAFKARNVTVSIQTVPPLPEGSAEYYKNCLVKLLSFKMHHINPKLRRVLIMDSDQLVVKNLDYLFETLPAVDLAAPRAYWINRSAFSSTFMLINLSERLWHQVEGAMSKISVDKYDMDIINDILGDTVMLLSGTYVTLNSHWEDWNLPTWYHAEDDFSNITAEAPVAAKPVTTIADQAVDEVLSHAGKNFHPPADKKPSKSNWRRRLTRRSSTDGLSSLSDTASKPNIHALPDDAAVHASHLASIPSSLPAHALGIPAPDADGPASAAVSAPLREADMAVAAFAQHPAAEVVAAPPRNPVSKEQRPLYKELFALYPEAAVVHYFALGKPWTWPVESVVANRPEAHPVFYQQFREWRESALRVCPGLIEQV